MAARILELLDLGVCNCAQCECLLLGERTAAMLDNGDAQLYPGVVTPPRVAMRAGGRPYCMGCSGSESDGERVARRLALDAEHRPDILNGRVIRKDHSNLTGD